MVGVASSNLVAPTKFGRKNKHLAETLGAFFSSYGKRRWYIMLANVKGVLAFFRIREVNGVPVLRCLKCWPKEVTEAFV